MLVALSYRTLCNPVGCSPLGSSVHRILQASILEWVAIPFSRGSVRPTDRTHALNAGRFFHFWATREALKQLTQQCQAWPTDLEMSATLGSRHQAWRLRTQGQCVSLFTSFPFPSSDNFWYPLAETHTRSSLLYWLSREALVFFSNSEPP